jgi:hypothetical protein
MKDSLAGRCVSSPLVLAAWCLAVATGSQQLSAAPQADAAGPRQFLRSANLTLYTDLPAADANALLERLESMLGTVSNYWRRPLRGTIQCYVAQNLDAWHDRELPHPMARILIGRVGGAAISQWVGEGGQEHCKIVVLASARPGVAEHEVVHAYCGQTFGTTGPLWYREGMAQMLACGQDRSHGMDFPPEILECLTAEKKQSLAEVVCSGQNVKQLCDSFEDKATAHDGLVGLVPDSQWSDADVRSLGDIKETYAWSWLVCHLLEYNPNYRARFQALGQDYLANQEDTFAKRFDPVARELAFEYQFTIAHMAPGYRVDLCAWDWGKHVRCLSGGRPVRARVEAARGYQASGLLVTAGQSYTYKASGSWTADVQAGPTSADGGAQDGGRLEAVVMRDYQLSEPILLGQDGTFAAPCDGQLYLRCRDDWSRLGDNEGSIVVAIAHAK